MDQLPDVPHPGSREALDQGCTCPVMDNCHGEFPPFPAGTPWGGKTGAWYIVVGCPLHDHEVAS